MSYRAAPSYLQPNRPGGLSPTPPCSGGCMGRGAPPRTPSALPCGGAAGLRHAEDRFRRAKRRRGAAVALLGANLQGAFAAN